MSDNDNIINLLRDEFKHVNDRLDIHYEMFIKHSDQDTERFEDFRKEFKTGTERITNVETDLKVAKRVGLALGTVATSVISWLGLSK